MINCILVFCFTTDQPSRYLQIVLKKFFDLNLMPEPPSERFERTAYNVYNVYLQLSVVLNNFFQMNFKRFFALFHFVVPLLLLLFFVKYIYWSSHSKITFVNACLQYSYSLWIIIRTKLIGYFYIYCSFVMYVQLAKDKWRHVINDKNPSSLVIKISY